MGLFEIYFNSFFDYLSYEIAKWNGLGKEKSDINSKLHNCFLFK